MIFKRIILNVLGREKTKEGRRGIVKLLNKINLFSFGDDFEREGRRRRGRRGRREEVLLLLGMGFVKETEKEEVVGMVVAVEVF